MPPRRPLPDLCLIVVLKMLPPNEQLKASKMCPRATVLIRAANRQVKKLRITEAFFDDDRKWKCLFLNINQKLDAANIEEIVYLFSAVTNLELFASSCFQCENFLALLKQPKWANQLTSLLMIIFREPGEQIYLLLTAINVLTVLQCLNICWYTEKMNIFSIEYEIPDMPILKQLKKMHFRARTPAVCSFLRSLEIYAPQNCNLQVSLDCYPLDSCKDCFHLYKHARNCIVYNGDWFNFFPDDVPRLCHQFPNLTHLSAIVEPSQVGKLFTALAQLQQLAVLLLRFDFKRNPLKENSIRPPGVKLDSVQTLHLELTISNHSQIEWLNLQATLPNLKVIKLLTYDCDNCKIEFHYAKNIYNSFSTSRLSTALKCFRATLPKLHSGVAHDQFTVDYGKHTLEELLSAEQ